MVEQSSFGLFRSSPGQDYEALARQQGVGIDVPPRFLRRDNLPTQTRYDRLTGLPIEEDELRKHLVSQLSEAIRTDTGWVLIYGDGDNMKVGNDIHRSFGDVAVKQSAANFADALSFLPDSVPAYIVRQKDAADEMFGWVFNIKEHEVDSLNQIIEEKASKKIPINNPKFLFSTSYAVLSSYDEDMHEMTRQTREHLPKDKYIQAFTLYSGLKEIAENKVRLTKLAKDIQRIPVDSLQAAQGLVDVRERIVAEIGGTRISKPLLDAVIEIAQAEAMIATFNASKSEQQIANVLQMVGMTLQQFAGATTDQVREKLYEKYK